MLCYHGNQSYSLKGVAKTESDVTVKKKKNSDFPRLRLVLDGNAGSCSVESDLIGSHHNPPSHFSLSLFPSLFLFRMVTLP